MRKKRLMRMIVIVVSCALFLSVIAFIWMKKDKKEYASWQARYKGVWTSSDGNYEMTVRRVTSAHVVFSIVNKKSKLTLDYASAVATGDGEYSFQYGVSRNMAGTVSVGYGNKGSGTIKLKEKSLALVVPAVEKFANCLEFHGTLKKKSGLPSVKRTNLQTFMGGSRSDDYREDKDCYIVEEEAGKINRVHINWDADRSREDCEKYEMAGINSICFVADLQEQFGDPIEEEELEENRYKRVYEKDGYRYEFITEGYGLVAEGDCQYQTPKRGRRVGDFLMDGDTIIRYLGDYQKKRAISLPKGTKKIANGAFSVAPNLLSWKQYVTSEVRIPKGIQIEKEAFRSCARLKIILEEGWTSVPREAFAHMVEEDNITGKSGWVEVTLPKSLRRLEEKAFETNWFSDDMGETLLATQPVTVRLNDELEYIGDNALFGINNTVIPKNLKYLGTNFYLSPTYLEYVQEKVTQPGKKSDEWAMVYLLTLPEQIEEAAENSFYFGEIGAPLANSIIIKVPEKCKTVPYLSALSIFGYDVEAGNKNYCDKSGWLFSKDGKVLYATSCVVDYGKEVKGRTVVYKKGKKDMDSSTYIYIEEGVEEIAAHALSACNYAYNEYSNCNEYVTPKSLKRIDRGVLFGDSLPNYGDYIVKITGEVPQFSGEFSENIKFMNKVFVKQQYRQSFIQALTKGQKLTGKQKTQLKGCIVGY